MNETVDTGEPCTAYCYEHARCRLRNNLPAHYFDCDSFQTYNYGLKQGKCDCSATADIECLLSEVAS